MNELESVSDRIKAVIKLRRMSDDQVDAMRAQLKLAYTTWRDIIQGTTQRPQRLPEIAEALGVDPLWLATGKAQVSGSSAARFLEIGDIERTLSGIPLAALVVAAPDEEVGDGHITSDDRAALRSPPLQNDMVLIRQYDAWASMGFGAPMQDHVDVVRAMRVSLSELRRQIRGAISAPVNLAILTAFGSSMRPTFEDGDPLLVDTGVQEIDREGVYVLQRDDQLYVKRMQRRITDGSLLMISDNRDEHPYPEQIPREAVGRDFFVRGRVLMVWNAKKL